MAYRKFTKVHFYVYKQYEISYNIYVELFHKTKSDDTT